VRATEEATAEAEKHASRCEALAALVALARDMLQKARAAEAERARAAAEAAKKAAASKEAAVAAEAVAKAAAAAELLQMEEQMAALALRMQAMQAQLGVAAAPPPPHAEDTLCVVCLDEPKAVAMVPCMHMCACEACAQSLLHVSPPRCPVCRAPIEHTTRVYW
jgi:uncharacterized coiled-coil protein SlyX